MDLLLTAAAFFAVLGVLVCFHELGHFTAAKLFRVRVDEFGFGFPPRIIGIRVRNTLYSLNIIPLGGFVKIKGIAGERIEQTDEEKAPDTVQARLHDDDSFAAKTFWQRLTILLAGIAANFILAAILFTGALMLGVQHAVPDEQYAAHIPVEQRHVLITQILEGSPAAQAGLRIGDVVSARDGVEVHAMDSLRGFSDGDAGSTITLTVERDGTEVSVPVTVQRIQSADTSYIGMGLSLALVYEQRLPFHKAVPEGIRHTGRMIVGVFQGIGQMATNAIRGDGSVDQLAGPVGIAQITGQALQFGPSSLLQLMALLSVNLGVFNLLPLPALDGGRLAFLVIEKLRGKPVDERIEAIVHNTGFLLLLALILLVTYKDIARILQ